MSVAVCTYSESVFHNLDVVLAGIAFDNFSDDFIHKTKSDELRKLGIKVSALLQEQEVMLEIMGSMRLR